MSDLKICKPFLIKVGFEKRHVCWSKEFVCVYARCIPTWFRFLHVLPAAAPVGHAVDGVAGVLTLALAGVVHQPVRAQLPAGATCNMTHVYRADTCTWPAGMVDTTPRTLSNCFGQF